MSDCIFCKIANKEIKANMIHEDNDFVVFADLAPKAKFHYLAVPKAHYATLAEMSEKDAETIDPQAVNTLLT